MTAERAKARKRVMVSKGGKGEEGDRRAKETGGRGQLGMRRQKERVVRKANKKNVIIKRVPFLHSFGKSIRNSWQVSWHKGRENGSS